MKKLIVSQSENYYFRVNYYAEDSGHIWSEYKQNYIKEYDDKDGYKKVLLSTSDKATGKGHRFSVHRLILSTFNPVANMQNLQVDHIDGDITNNTLLNLRWTTARENLENPNTKIHRRVYDQDGTHNCSAKFDYMQLLQLIYDVNSGSYTKLQICQKYQITNATLNHILNKEHYKNELYNIKIMPIFLDAHARDTRGEQNGRAKLKQQDVLEIIKLLQSKKYSYKEIGKFYNVSATTIWHIYNHDTWTHLTKNINFN